MLCNKLRKRRGHSQAPKGFNLRSRFRLPKFAAVHGSIHNHFNKERALTSRTIFKERRAAALNEWRELCTD